MLATLPPHAEMVRAFLAADPEYDGLFLTGVRTTGIFCRPSCGARKPLPENVEFFRSTEEALAAGYRSCKRCQPMELPGSAPAWLTGLLAAAEQQPERRWREADLREHGLNPDRVRRWFLAQHGMTFHAWQRARRLGNALDHLRAGEPVLPTAYDHGYESLSGFTDALRRLVGGSPAAVRGATVVSLLRLPTPLGPMLAGATDEGVCLLEFTDRRMLERQLKTLHRRLACAFVPCVRGKDAVLDQLAAELEGYFAGTVRAFSAPLVLHGSEFQRAVWNHLREIPWGATTHYGALARQLGRPAAVRAVARANGDNRIAILIPCHRVIGRDGQLTGYGGGLWRKRWLLDLEQRAAAAPAAAAVPRSVTVADPARPPLRRR